ncbi:hypothetical protein, partial [Novosphingobium sp. SG751A]|uniref:hypothetical protein n=1 Tax=Novosphingobium sp. SG751A TaxID=2587000 RepID=UPI001C12AD3A
TLLTQCEWTLRKARSSRLCINLATRPRPDAYTRSAMTRLSNAADYAQAETGISVIAKAIMLLSVCVAAFSVDQPALIGGYSILCCNASQGSIWR